MARPRTTQATAERPARRPVVAAGARIVPTNKRQVKRLEGRRPEWEAEAWDYYDSVPEVRRCYNLLAVLIGRCQLRVGWYPEPWRADVVPAAPPMMPTAPPADGDVTPAGGTGTQLPPSWPLPDVLAAAQAVLQRMLDGFGGPGPLLHPLSVNLGVPGDAYVIAYTPAPPPAGAVVEDEAAPPASEVWGVYAADIVTVENERVALRDGANGAVGTVLPADAFICRVWTPHPRSRDKATSDLRALLDDLSELVLLRRAIRGAHRSRMNAGVVGVAMELEGVLGNTPVPDDVESDDPQEPGSFADDLMDAMLKPIEDEADPASVVPIVVPVPSALLANGGWLKHQTFERPVDAQALAERDQLVDTITRGLPLPPEAIKGVGDVNHWSAWQVSEDTFRTGAAPTVEAICQALTVGLLWPMLEDAKLPPAEAHKVCIWYDPGDAIKDPDPIPVLAAAHGAGVVNDAAYRRALASYGITDADAPSVLEILLRLTRQRAPMTADYTAQSLEIFNDGVPLLEFSDPLAPVPATTDPAGAPANDTPDSDGPPAGEDASSAPARLAALLDRLPERLQGELMRQALGLLRTMRASGAPPRLDPVEGGRRLGEIERTLQAHLLAVADAAVSRAVERVANRTRTAALRSKDARVKAQATSVARAGDLPRALGRTVTAALGGGDEDAIRAELEEARAQYAAAVAAAGDEMLQVLAAMGPESAAPLVLGAGRELATAIDTSATFFVDLLANDAMRALFEDPNITAAQLGEIDRALKVTPEHVRRALAVAGGGDASSTAPDVGGLTGGRLAENAAAQAGLRLVGYTWRYGAGMRRQPFEAHRALDGTEFSSWEDPKLSTSLRPDDAWVGAYFHPGDHAYCQCDAEPRFEPREVAAEQ